MDRASLPQAGGATLATPGDGAMLLQLSRRHSPCVYATHFTDFSMCAATVELDCGMLAAMTGRTANAPRFGPPV